MRGFLLAVLLTSACAPAARNDSLSHSPSFRARALAIAATRGARGKSPEIAAKLAALLGPAGLPVSALEESDSVLAGGGVGLEAAANPRLLDEIRRATGADAVVFLSLPANWSTLEITALDTRTGDAVLRSVVRPRGDAYAGPADIADAAARALSFLAAERRAPKASRPDEPPLGEIPLP